MKVSLDSLNIFNHQLKSKAQGCLGKSPIPCVLLLCLLEASAHCRKTIGRCEKSTTIPTIRPALSLSSKPMNMLGNQKRRSNSSQIGFVSQFINCKTYKFSGLSDQFRDHANGGYMIEIAIYHIFFRVQYQCRSDDNEYAHKEDRGYDLETVAGNCDLTRGATLQTRRLASSICTMNTTMSATMIEMPKLFSHSLYSGASCRPVDRARRFIKQYHAAIYPTRLCFKGGVMPNSASRYSFFVPS